MCSYSIFFVNQKTAYELRISDWSSDVCSSDLAKVKKRLEIDPFHAETVRTIFRLALEGDGVSGSMGVKAIAAWLNERSIRTRDGGRWGLGAVHQILTRSTYTGRHEFNRRGKDRKLKPKSEAVVVRSEEHTSELQSLMRISYDVFC